MLIHAIVVLALVAPCVVNSASSGKPTDSFQCPVVCNGMLFRLYFRLIRSVIKIDF
ncbi:hypothetical protein TSMEX_002195 [Taenia solium]|eukprot:TsM_000130600 transcript=TsM_000130600 gene=TsM_000130600